MKSYLLFPELKILNNYQKSCKKKCKEITNILFLSNIILFIVILFHILILIQDFNLYDIVEVIMLFYLFKCLNIIRKLSVK